MTWSVSEISSYADKFLNLYVPQYKSFENTVGRGEIARINRSGHIVCALSVHICLR